MMLIVVLVVEDKTILHIERPYGGSHGEILIIHNCCSEFQCSIGNFYICETNMLLFSSSVDNPGI